LAQKSFIAEKRIFMSQKTAKIKIMEKKLDKDYLEKQRFSVEH
jgi:hypothetical protein